MREKIRILFFITLAIYVATLSSGSYLSVYITYFTIPILVILGLFIFGSFKSINKIAKAIFHFSLLLTVGTIATVSYVGVYLVYFEVPIMIT